MDGRRPDSEVLVRIVIPLPDGEWHGLASETLWAEPLPESAFRIRNVSFYARGISFGDSVSVHGKDDSPLTVGDDPPLVVDKVVARGGHSTYRIRLLDDVSLEDLTFDKYWPALESEGCSYERATERLLGVDVPPSADIHKVYELLSSGEEGGAWSFEEGHCGHAVS